MAPIFFEQKQGAQCDVRDPFLRPGSKYSLRLADDYIGVRLSRGQLDLASPSRIDLGGRTNFLARLFSNVVKR